MVVLIEEIRQPNDGSVDPFRYGWRYRESYAENGELVVAQIPLSLEDVLHPQEGDQVTHSNEHQSRRRYLCDVFEGQLRHDPTAVVLDDVRVAWDIPDLGAHSPDIAVILGVRERKNWSTFDVAREGVRPALLVEMTSPETAVIDRSVKVDEYEIASVPLYVIVDGVSRRREPPLRIYGFSLEEDGYHPIITNEQGHLWLEPVKLWLGVDDGDLVCHDASGQRLGNFVAQLDRADTAEQRVRELETELARLKGEQSR